MSHSRKLKILVLIQEGLRPPEDVGEVDLTGVAWDVEYDVISTLRAAGHEVEIAELDEDLLPMQKIIDTWKPHITFNLLEGFKDISLFDQNVVSYLELLGLPYTGCNPRGLMVARHKALAKKILRYHGIVTPHFQVIRRGLQVSRPKDLCFPLIVKSASEEASTGISMASIVHDDEKLIERVRFIHETVKTSALVESYIEGRELYVGVIGNQRLEALPVWELFFPKSKEGGICIATEKVKYSAEFRKKHGIDSGEARGLGRELESEIHEISKKAYRVLGLNGYARLDFRLGQDGKLYLLEANPNPHLAKSEDFARSAEKHGLSYSDLVWRILSLGQRWEPQTVSMVI